MQAIQGMEHLAHHVNDLRARIDGEGLADGLAAHGQPRHEGGHDQRNAPRPAHVHLRQDQRRNGRRRAAAEADPETTPQISPTTSLQMELTRSALRRSRMAS